MTKPADQSQPVDAQQVMHLLERQRDLYVQLKALADQQGRLIEEGATEQLLSLLAQRQSLIDMLGQCSAEISPYRSRIGDIAAQAGGGMGDKVRSLVEEVRSLLESIMEQDDRGRSELAASRDAVSSQLKQTTGAVGAVGAYAKRAAAGVAARYTDRRG